MADTYPSTDLVATAIVAACKITGGDPIAVASGEIARGKIGYEASRARAYAALALKEANFGCGAQAIARMVGTPSNSVSCYVGSLEFQRRQGGMKWLDTKALSDLVALIRGYKKFASAAPAKPKVVARPVVYKPKEPGRVFSLSGIIVDFTEGAETLRFAGKDAAVSPRQALPFEALAKGMPNPIGRDFLRHRLFSVHGSITQKDVQLDLVVGDAKRAAATVGLKINELKGIGFSLVKP